jgi:hypothetical protein
MSIEYNKVKLKKLPRIYIKSYAVQEKSPYDFIKTLDLLAKTLDLLEKSLVKNDFSPCDMSILRLYWDIPHFYFKRRHGNGGGTFGPPGKWGKNCIFAEY